MKYRFFLVSLSSILLLASCSVSFSTGRYHQAHDSHPDRLPTNGELAEITPKYEPKSKGGNKDYAVRGKFYQVLDSAKNFKQTGIASWYGKKFHGHLTSNGEIYNMYSMSAAHKSLPLPTYLKVTNLTNHKSVIVRVNDRGPFHESRIIDLSYSAAYKLDMLKTGTAKVKIEAITDFSKANKTSAITQTRSTPTVDVNHSVSTPKEVYIQVFATRNQTIAQQTATGLSMLYQIPVNLPKVQGIYKIQLGPFEDIDNAKQVLIALQQNGYPKAYRLWL